MGSEVGKVFAPKGFDWDRSIPEEERSTIVDRIMRLPAWVDHQLGTDNLDVKKLEKRDLWRLRSGAYRVVFQKLDPHVVIHRVFRKTNESEYDAMASIVFVRSAEGLRKLADDIEEAAPVPETRAPVVRPAMREVVQNPLSPFTDAELTDVGLDHETVAALRAVPAQLLPDTELKRRGVERDVIRFVAELWERPGDFVGKELRIELAALTETEAAGRLESEYSSLSLLPIERATDFLALLDGTIEEWMIYLHPSQAGAVKRAVTGPSRVRGAAGTGKTVVALHRARFIADQTGGRVLLTTFVNNLPKVWRNLLASFPDEVRGRIDCRTVNQVALDLYRRAGGQREIADDSQRDALIHEAWSKRQGELGGLTQIGLQEEVDHMIVGRSLTSVDEYMALPRTGRGTPLGAAAREVVWEAYEEYDRRMGKERLTYWPELRRDALLVQCDGRAQLHYDAVIADEAQDLGEASILLLAEMCGGLPEPNLTLVGDGQQSIYPGGFSLLQLGIDIRGARATVLRTNWRNGYWIWRAAKAFVDGIAFDDLEDDPATSGDVEESEAPMREGVRPGLWIVPPADEAALAAEVVRETLELGAELGNVAILAPTNQRAKEIRSVLAACSLSHDDLAKYDGVHRTVVWVGTFHRAKGLEFKHVVVTGLNAAIWPPKRQGLHPAAREEARARDVRAAYVAMTRARDRLDVVVGGEPAEPLARAVQWFDQH
jgi:mRNA-degrading endonuclease RelE of RelBE toxin-antitoxin system